MGYRHHRAGEALQIIFQNGQGHYVQIVGGLVQQQHVGGVHEDAQQIEPPPLTARQPPDGHRLPFCGEEEPLHHLLGAEGALVGAGFFGNAVDKVVDPHVQVQLPAFLREMPDLHGRTLHHPAAVRGQFSGDDLEQGGLAGAVFAHDADAVLPQQVIGEIRDHLFVAKGLGDPLQLDELLAQTAGGGAHTDGFLLLGGILVQKGFVPGDALLGLGAAGAAPPHDPFPLHPQDGLSLALAGLFHFGPLGLEFQIVGVIGLVMVELAPAQLGDVVDHPFQKIAIVGHHDQPAPEPPQTILQPGGHFGVQMVGGLVQHQHIGRMDEGGCQGHPLALTARQGADLLVIIGDAQLVQHGLGLVLIELPELGRKVQEYLLQNGGLIVHGGVLGQKTHLHIGIAGYRALVGGQFSRKDLQKGGFSRSVDADDTGFVSVVQIKVHVLQQLAVAKVHGQMFSR